MKKEPLFTWKVKKVSSSAGISWTFVYAFVFYADMLHFIKRDHSWLGSNVVVTELKVPMGMSPFSSLYVSILLMYLGCTPIGYRFLYIPVDISTN